MLRFAYWLEASDEGEVAWHTGPLAYLELGQAVTIALFKEGPKHA